MNEIRQSEYYGGPYMEVKGFRKLEKLWDQLSRAIEDPAHEVPETEVLEFRQRKAARHGRQIKAVRDAQRCGYCGKPAAELLAYPLKPEGICQACWNQII